MPKITTFLWFDANVEEVANFYVSIFKNSKISKVTRYEGAGPNRDEIQVVEFELDGKPLIALNGRPQQFGFNESVSLSVECKSQAEVDHYWNKLISGGGEESMCGWLKDKYGLSWQITPSALLEAINDPDKARAKRAMGAMIKMKKIDIAEVKRAAEGK